MRRGVETLSIQCIDVHALLVGCLEVRNQSLPERLLKLSSNEWKSLEWSPIWSLWTTNWWALRSRMTRVAKASRGLLGLGGRLYVHRKNYEVVGVR
jgi:hypothetical protein